MLERDLLIKIGGMKMRVLFVGNSHTFFNDMPEIFRRLAKTGRNMDVEVTMQAHPGVPFAWHLSQMAELRFALVQGRYDYMVIQQAAHVPCPSKEETLRDGKMLINLAKQCGVTPIICMPWAEKRFPEHQAVMYDTFRTLAEETGTGTTATGYVFEDVFKNHPEINLYFADGEHCNPYGSYVRALSVYAAIFGVSPVGLPAESIRSCTIDEAVAAGYPAVQAQMDLDPDNEELKKKMMEFFGAIRSIWKREDTIYPLDPVKAAVLQELVWKYTK